LGIQRLPLLATVAGGGLIAGTLLVVPVPLHVLDSARSGDCCWHLVEALV
jgi:hypothetical protein